MISDSEFVAQAFHETYEELAPLHGYKTREASAVPWEDVPAANKELMINVAHHLLDGGVISLSSPRTSLTKEDR